MVVIKGNLSYIRFMERLHYIYGLYSTRHLKKTYPPKIKYIGRTDNPKTRLLSHINDSRKGKLSPLYEWMRNEMGKGGEIKMTLLHQCGEFEVKEQERIFIEKNKGRNLLNVNGNELRTPHHLSKQVKSLNHSNLQLSQKIRKLEKYIIDSGLELPYTKNENNTNNNPGNKRRDTTKRV
jgi:hypothetical protein